MAPVLTTPVGRVRFALGDHDDTDVLLEGGEAQYTALLARFAGNEEACFRAAALALAGFYAAQPVRIGSAGDQIDYADRVPTWREMADGTYPYPFRPDGVAAAPNRAPRLGAITAGANAGKKLR